MVSAALLIVLALSSQNEGSFTYGTPEWRALRKRVAQDRVKATYLQKEQVSILKGLRTLDKQLRESTKKVDSLSQRQASIDSKLKELSKQIAASEVELNSLRRQAGRRASAMVRLRRTRLSRILENLQNPVLARQTQDRFGFVFQYDRALIRSTKQASLEYRALRYSLDHEQKSHKETIKALAEAQEKSELVKIEREALLEAVKKERRAAHRLASELSRAARKLEQEMGRVRGSEPAPDALPGDFRQQRGILPWPVAGAVELTFGKKVDLQSGVVLLQKGLDIRAPQSTAVRNVFPGKVMYSDWFDGYGRLVIVHHPGGFYSLYAHLERSLVKVGQQIAQYAVVGLLGDSGSTKGSYLYFELRQGREPVDPMLWLKD